MPQHPLSPSTTTLPTHRILLTPTNPNCRSLLIQAISPNSQALYQETVDAGDFGDEDGSLLFLKLAIESGRVQAIRVGNLVWDKVVVGKDNVENAMRIMNDVGAKRYEGLVIKMQFPQHIAIVLPELKDATQFR